MCMSTTTRTHHCRDGLEVIEPPLQNLRISPGFAVSQPPDGAESPSGIHQPLHIAVVAIRTRAVNCRKPAHRRIAVVHALETLISESGGTMMLMTEARKLPGIFFDTSRQTAIGSSRSGRLERFEYH